jgi:hypothetical protein
MRAPQTVKLCHRFVLEVNDNQNRDRSWRRALG